jgi:Gram-negative bacterial TonB protein C-terminal
MSALANSLHKPERFDAYVRRFRAICGMHGIQVGSRGDLCGFMQKLMEDRHLSMDFWSFVGKLSGREGGELSDDQMLAVIVEGVTGGESSEEDGRVVDDLRAMLAGVDIQGPGKGQVELAAFPPRSETGPPQADGELRPRVLELPLKARFSRAAFSPEVVNEEANHATASPTTLPPQLDETLVRLGVANLVKQYLEDIDNRVRKLEAQPEGEAAAVAIADATTPRSLEEPPEKPPKEEREDPPITFVGNARLVLEPDASALATHKPKGNRPPIRVPLENYSQPKGFGRTVFEVGLALALFEAAFLGYQHRPPLREQIDAFAQDVHNSLVQKIENFWASAAATAHPIPPPTRVSGSELSREPILQGTSTPPPASTNASTSHAQAALGSLAAPVGSGSSSSKTTDHAEAPAEPESATDRLATADEAGAVRVAPAAMEANLVVSRVPVYPEVAKADRIEGHVLMEAIISKNGFVKRVHVIEGDSRLRGAATEAVYKRLYRPYILNGEPVDVATTVTVDFKLDRWRGR